MSFDSRTLEVVEWPQVQACLRRECRSPFGQELASGWQPGSLNEEQSKLQSLAVLELFEFQKQTELRLPVQDVADIRPILKRISRSGSISEEEFAALVNAHKNMQGLAQFMRRYLKEQPRLQKILEKIDTLEEWSEEHFAMVDQHGKIVDDATGDLFALRKLVRDLHEQIKDRLNDFLNNPRMAELMQDFYITVRQGRYVIPVKSNFKGRVPGIIHDLSKTEQTLFVEPESVVELNNKLKIAQKEIELEIERILVGVVSRTQPLLKSFESNLALLARADLMDAAAVFFNRLQGEISAARWEGDYFKLQKLRHPLLALRERVIPNDLSWNKGFVLTGPNTGGKTVLLKSLGLSLCLARAGFPVMAERAVFPEKLDDLFVDIGDEQDIDQDLSTFSAHLKILEKFLENSSEHSLVLIDEIATATAPEEGECLAQAYLEHLLDKKVSFFVTTHYGRVKTFAMSEKRCRIAAMALNSKTRRPTYDLVMDIPGDSSALDTAEAFGLPNSLIERARALRGNPSEETTKAVERLQQAREGFREREEELEKQIQDFQRKTLEMQKRQDELNERIRNSVEKESRELLKELGESKKELSERLKQLRDQDLSVEGPKLFTKISDLGQQIREKINDSSEESDLSSQELFDFTRVKTGDFVEVSGLGLGKIVEMPDTKRLSSNTLVLVQVGEIKTRVSMGRLKSASKSQIQHFETQRQIQNAALNRKQRNVLNLSKEPSAVGSTVCDVRGKTVEEAMNRVELALNSLLRGDDTSITIIHGHGGEKLKNEIRNYLSKERDDLNFRSGSWPGEGGDGVTVVEKAY